MFRSKNWFGGGLWRPKNPHSLEHLKYLHNVLSKNQIVNEDNKGLLVETLRSIAEILIWGDQNDSTVFDFFLEKNMLSFFLKIMKQKCGRYVCVQLLQTLNILFENIRNETSLYYLLSNNHVNSIIVHKFDFSDEEVMAYYISFLKTLSLKLNTHTVHFFYNEHTNDFPLYTEAIKFFNHGESMVRIAVRTLTLNVYKVEDKSMLKFIRDKTAAPYFSNLVWFIGSHVLELDACIRNDADHQSRNRLADLVAEHLDHMHYLNDILCLLIEALNEVLTDHLLNRLFIPLYVYSLTKRRRQSQIEDDRPHVSSVVSLFLLSQVFLIISHKPLVRQLADIILNKDLSIFSDENSDHASNALGQYMCKPGFMAPPEPLEKSLETRLQETWHGPSIAAYNQTVSTDANETNEVADAPEQTRISSAEEPTAAMLNGNAEVQRVDGVGGIDDGDDDAFVNITDEEKQRQMEASHRWSASSETPLVIADVAELSQENFSLTNRPYLEAIFNALECSENDYAALFALCLLFALGHNPGVHHDLLNAVFIPTDRSETKHWYNVSLVERLIRIITISCQYNSKVRLATLEMSLVLLKQMVLKNGHSFLQDPHLAALEGAREESTLLLRNFYKSEEIFLDMFEDEYREISKKPLNVEYLTMDSNILLTPIGTPLTGIELYKRLPCGEVERARRAIRVFYLLRDLSLTLRKDSENQLPLSNPNQCIMVGDILDLNNSDLIACTIIAKDAHKIRRFLVIDVLQLILVEPDSKRLGWGVSKFVGFLQDIEVSGDKDDSRCLHVTVHRPLSSTSANRIPLLSAKFVFDDHIRCMAAKQRLTKGRMKARQRKMHQIAKLLELPGHIQPCPSPPVNTLQGQRHHDIHRRIGVAARGIAQDHGATNGPGRGRVIGNGAANHATHHHKPLFMSSGNKVPGFAAAAAAPAAAAAAAATRSRGDNVSSGSVSPKASGSSHRLRRRPSRSPSRPNGSVSAVNHADLSNDIPLEDLSANAQSPRIREGSRKLASRIQRRLSSPKPLPSSSSLSSSALSPLRRTSDSSLNGITTTSAAVLAAPKTLRPAEAPSVSLVHADEEVFASVIVNSVLSSPRIVVPVAVVGPSPSPSLSPPPPSSSSSTYPAVEVSQDRDHHDDDKDGQDGGHHETSFVESAVEATSD